MDEEEPLPFEEERRLDPLGGGEREFVGGVGGLLGSSVGQRALSGVVGVFCEGKAHIVCVHCVRPN